LRREKKDKTPRSAMTTKRRLEVMVKWGHCYLCLAKLTSLEDTQFDHVIPLELGGTDDVENIQPAHAECHRDKTRGDARDIAKMRRRIKKEDEHHLRRDNRTPGERREKQSRLPSRPFNTKSKPNVRQIADE
jgi:5-methylcytosine-specific restriction endonuclease McrA